MKSKTSIVLCLLCLAFTFVALPKDVSAQETLTWSADVSSNGSPVTSPVLDAGRQYRIVAEEIWFYNVAGNYWADAQYYTDGIYGPFIPDGHSFLQIDGQDVYWGPYNNEHMYSIYYIGTGAAVTFRIVDWIDEDYNNNYCHLPVQIWEQPMTEAGYSPGYWKHQFNVYYGSGRGSPQESLEDLVAWTSDIDGYYGVTPPALNGYTLPPVGSMDTDGDGVFEPLDAYNVLWHKQVYGEEIWLGCANWYNWAAGYGPYYGD